MAYWWVNQNQTWGHEIEGGFLWSPKRNRNGNFNQFYENMRVAELGDLVFSYFDQRIQYVGIVQRPALSGNKPSEFGLTGDYWDNQGWFVPIVWHKAPSPFWPKEIISRLLPYLPEKYSPLDQDGDGLQGVYLAAIPEPMAEILIEETGIDLSGDLSDLVRGIGDGGDVVEKLDDDVEVAIRNNTEIDETERQAIIKARRGQGQFRRNLENIELSCRITGVSDPRLLRASHVKPWRSCANNHERLDGYNGLLLAPHVDHLFDRGYISFSDEGELLVSVHIDPEQLERLGIRAPLAVVEFTDEQKQYLSHHREQVFRS